MKKHGFKIRIDAFVEVDRKDYAKQRDAYATMATIQETGTVPLGFLESCLILGVTAKEGSAEVPDAPAKEPEPETPVPETTGMEPGPNAPAGRKPKPNPDGGSD